MRTWLGGVGVLLAVMMGAAVRGEGGGLPFTVGRETTRIVGPLRGDGTVDYVAAVNEKYRVKVEENGLVPFLRALDVETRKGITREERDQWLEACGATAGGGAFTCMDYERWIEMKHPGEGAAVDVARDKANTEAQRATQQYWDGAMYPDLAEYLAAQQKGLDAIAQSASKPAWWLPCTESRLGLTRDKAWKVLSPMRWHAHTLCARAMGRLARGDFDGYVADVRAAFKLAAAGRHGISLDERLIGAASDYVVWSTLGAAAGEGRLTVEQCQGLTTLLEEMSPVPPASEALRGYERWVVLDRVAALATGKDEFFVALPGMPGPGPDVMRLRVIERGAVDWDGLMKEVNRWFEEKAQAAGGSLEALDAGRAAELQELGSWRVELAETPGGLRRGAGETREAYTGRVARGILVVLGRPYLRGEYNLLRSSNLKRAMVDALLAAARVKARSGKWPATLEELVPGELAEVPEDLFYGEKGRGKVKYRVKEGKARVYSVGMNGVDDGGESGGEKDDRWVGGWW